jgi:C4-dicarboxylate transporter, DctQ subunit
VAKLLDRVCAALAVVAASLFLFLTFSICYSIFTRTVGLYTPVWTVQFDEYSMLWLTFLGTAWLLSRNRHVSIELVVSRFGEKGKRVFRTVHDFLGLFLCATLCYFSAACTWDHFLRNVIDVQGVDVPKAYVIVVIPLGFLLLFLQFIRRIVDDFRGTAVKGRGH